MTFLDPTPPPQDYPDPIYQGQEIMIPAGTKLIVVSHWDWPFAWIMSGVFVIGMIVLWQYGKRHK